MENRDQIKSETSRIRAAGPEREGITPKPGRLAVFLATSGHSGVDRIMKNLLPSIASRGIKVDLLHVNNHGPHIEPDGKNLNVVELGTTHTFSSLLPLMKYLRREKPDVLLSDKDRPNRVAILAAMLARMPVKTFVRMGTTVSRNLASRGWIDRWTQRTSIRCLYPRAKGILMPSRGAADDFAEYAGIPGNRVTVVPSPVVTPELYMRAADGVTHPWFAHRSMPVIVGIGELCARKDFATLIRAFAVMRNQLDAKLFIMGEGRKKEELKKMAAELELADDVELPGFVQNPYAFLSRADLYVHSSRWEGLPVALIEAVGLGVPVVSTDCPSGPREILQNGKYGHLVDAGDVSAMATAMIDVLKNPPDREKIKEASAPFTLEESTARYMRVFDFAD